MQKSASTSQHVNQKYSQYPAHQAMYKKVMKKQKSAITEVRKAYSSLL